MEEHNGNAERALISKIQAPRIESRIESSRQTTQKLSMSTENKFDNLHTEMFQLGLQNRREIVGNTCVDAALNNGKTEFAYPGQQLVTE